MNRAFLLYRLQEVDTRLDQSKNRLREIVANLKNNTAVKEAEDKQAIAQSALDEAKKALRKAEENTRTQRQKIKVTEDKLYGGKIHNPKELQDLQMENESLKRFLEVLEERQLEAMLIVDELSAEYESREKATNEVRAHQIENHSALRGEYTKLKGMVEHLQVERRVAENPIAAEDLTMYESLRKRRAGVAIARATDKSCSACGNLLNTALFQTALSPTELATCDNCGRIIYAG